MKRICWFSQHKPLKVQISALREMFGQDIEVAQDIHPFSSAEEVKKRYSVGKYDDMVIVAPLSVIGKLVELGIKPLWCQMDVVKKAENADISYRGRNYKFNRFRRIRTVRIEFEDGE